MATTDIYTVTGDITIERASIRCLGGDVDDYIQVDAHAVARVAANDTKGTYSAWIMVPDITGTYTIVGAGDKNVVEFLELNVEAGLITARCTDATVAQFVTQADAIAITPHKWHHIAVVQAADGHGVRLYVDGSEIAATNDTATDVDEWYNNLDGIDSFRIGAANKAGDDTVTQEFKGYISDVKYWNRALTAAEVARDYGGTAIDDDSTYLQLHIDFKDDLIDSGLGADDGTNVGSGIKLCNAVSEFSSRLSFMTGTPVVADTIKITMNNTKGFALVIQAA